MVIHIQYMLKEAVGTHSYKLGRIKRKEKSATDEKFLWQGDLSDRVQLANERAQGWQYSVALHNEADGPIPRTTSCDEYRLVLPANIYHCPFKAWRSTT